MAKTVISAFNDFTKEKVNLDSTITSDARKSRDWLTGKIQEITSKDVTFPQLYNDKNIAFGSFARNTKERELDDIDLITCLSANGSTYCEKSDCIEITVLETVTSLKNLCNDETNILNSRKVINKLINLLDKVPQYKKADINRNKQAAVLNLSSYDWSFDIVPSFFTIEDSNGDTFYIIPDGNGNWMKTDPRIDRDRVKKINKKHGGNVLNVIRIIKYWNNRTTMPKMGSYLLENIILNYYDQEKITCGSYVDIEIPKVLLYISREIYNTVNDPKEIQGDINTLSNDERTKISDRAITDYSKATEARTFESIEDYKASINKWREIFGNEFPEYEGE